jgi:acetyl-CoA acetyltransferase
MNNLSGIAAIVGVAESDLGIVPNKNVFQLQAEAAKEALEDCGLAFHDVEAIFSAGPHSYLQTMTIAEYLNIKPKYTDNTGIGGSSFEAHVAHAVAGIHAGLFSTALITYGSTQRSEKFRPGSRIEKNVFEAPYAMPFPIGAYALAAQRHMSIYGTTSEHLAEIAVQTRKWAQLNPKAMKREPITVDDVLNSKMIASPLHILDCCLVTDGGGAIVITSKEKANDCKKEPIWILGTGETHTHMHISAMDDLTVTGASLSGKRAFEMAGMKPSDIDIVELYDSFTITVLLQLEDLGFCEKGEAGQFIQSRKLGPGGDFPLNTSGGGLSYCHPGLFGIFLLIEAVRQLRGECGDRQVDNVKTALCNGMGGVLSSSSTVILGRD